MFDQLLESSSGEEQKTKKPLTMTVSIIIHVVLIVAVSYTHLTLPTIYSV